jgi:hypothetical protein
MHSDHIDIAHDSMAETPGLGPRFTSYPTSYPAPLSHAEAAAEPMPVGFLTRGIAWLFGLEALLADETRR